MIFWAEAYDTFVHIHNHTGRSSVDNRTPYHILFGKPVAADHFCTFGSIGYMRVPPELHKKLMPKADKMLLIGYWDDAAYWMFDLLTRLIKYLQDIILMSSIHFYLFLLSPKI